MGICCSNRWNGMYKKDTEDQSFAKVLPLIAGTCGHNSINFTYVYLHVIDFSGQ